ncbi:hypothetical protein [Paraburkholderia sp. DGU8]|uniref:hypothetical protein n=1 Tax=Paraburkholderia sp. DGU8 TaxID=3161997 RepID=UPI00346742FD
MHTVRAVVAGKQARRAYTGLPDLERPRLDGAGECLSASARFGCYLLSGRPQQPLESQSPIAVVQATLLFPTAHLPATDDCTAKVCAGAAHALQTFRQSEVVREAGPAFAHSGDRAKKPQPQPDHGPHAPRFF